MLTIEGEICTKIRVRQACRNPTTRVSLCNSVHSYLFISARYSRSERRRIIVRDSKRQKQKMERLRLPSRMNFPIRTACDPRVIQNIHKPKMLNLSAKSLTKPIHYVLMQSCKRRGVQFWTNKGKSQGHSVLSTYCK